MIMLLLGLLDILAAVLLGTMAFYAIFKILIIFFGIALLIKGLIFIKSLASIIDLLAGAVLIAAVFITVPPILFWIAAILLIQKGIFSFF